MASALLEELDDGLLMATMNIALTGTRPRPRRRARQAYDTTIVAERRETNSICCRSIGRRRRPPCAAWSAG